MANNEINVNNTSLQEEEFNLREFLLRCMSKWYWFVISLILCLLVGIYIVMTTVPVYHSSAEVQIKSDTRGRSIDSSSEFADMGMFMTRTNVYNEMRTFRSPDLMGDVVEQLKLYMDYKYSGRRYDITLYGTSLPMEAELFDIPDTQNASFRLSSSKDGKIVLDDFKRMGEKLGGRDVKGSLGDTLSTPLGRVAIYKTSCYPEGGYGRSYTVYKYSKKKAVADCIRRLTVAQSEKRTDMINLGIDDVSTQRAQDIVSTLIAVYNVKWVQDKNMLARATSEFINDRLKVIEGELSNVDADISSYKSANMIPDVGAAADLYMQQNAAINNQMQELNNQLYMARYVKNYISNEGSNNQPLPSNMGITNSAVESRINEYNKQLIERNNLVENSGENNVLVKDMDKTLESMRNAISMSVDNEIMALNTRYNGLQGQSRATSAKIAANPKQANQLLSVERQQSVKQSLYLYLLQKREENELSQAFTAYNTRIIKHPLVSGPVAPRKSQIMLVTFLLGLLIPLALVYVIMASDTKIHSKKDLRALSLPYLGEIPLALKKKNLLGKIKRKAAEQGTVVVEHGNRNSINEAFRVMRTNLEFMTKDPAANVVSTTSFNPGSGKSFVTMNMAVCLAIKDKKVLVIDGDLRHGSLSGFAGNPEKGLSDFLAGKTEDIKSLIVQSENYPSLNVLPIGTVPPNPAELIADPKFGQMIGMLKKEYDYVLIDCPPIDIVTDAKIVNEFVDRTVFILRAGLLDKELVPELESMYKRGEYNNLCYVLNGTSSSSGYYGRYGRYGHYGHYGHYGYHSYYGGKEAKA
jgi:capsular exopolysaccharide synthesis family protein